MTALIVEKDSDITFIANMFNPLTASGVWQDALAKIYFINRHLAIPTTVTCICTGGAGTVIPAGSIVEDEAGSRYANAASATIGAGGTVEIVFSCLVGGEVQCAANSVNKIVTVTPGWDSVSNPAAGVTGQIEETRAQFEARRFASVASNSHGLMESVGSTISNLPDVIASKIVQNRENEPVEMLGVTVPPHSIYLSVYGGTADEIAEVLYNKLDAGCGTAGNTTAIYTDPDTGAEAKYYYTVPALVPVHIQATFAAAAVYSAEAVRQAIFNNFIGAGEMPRVLMGETLYASRLYCAVNDTGATGFVSIEISLEAGGGYGDELTFALNELPSLSIDDINIVTQAAT